MTTRALRRPKREATTWRLLWRRGTTTSKSDGTRQPRGMGDQALWPIMVPWPDVAMAMSTRFGLRFAVSNVVHWNITPSRLADFLGWYPRRMLEVTERSTYPESAHIR